MTHIGDTSAIEEPAVWQVLAAPPIGHLTAPSIGYPF
jgi:hypothetical protein